MKTREFSLESYSWAEQDIECPYEIMYYLFDYGSLEYFQEQIRNYCCYTLSDVKYDKATVAEVTMNLTILKSIFKAIYKIYLAPTEYEKRELTNKKVTQSELDEMKYLNKKEYKNPYLVFKNTFKKYTLEELSQSFLDLTLSAMADNQFHKDYSNRVSVLAFHKILEACLLIYVRDAGE